MLENQTEVPACTHTAGPWKAKPTTLPDVVEIRDSDGRQLASVYAVEYTNLRPVTVEETAANAELMAAAPAILEALIEVREAVAAAMRVMVTNSDAVLAFEVELARVGVKPGFGQRADTLIRRAKGEL